MATSSGEVSSLCNLGFSTCSVSAIIVAIAVMIRDCTGAVSSPSMLFNVVTVLRIAFSLGGEVNVAVRPSLARRCSRACREKIIRWRG